jgi:hypothetical protein
MIILYNTRTGKHFNANDVVLINTKDMNHHQLSELEDGNYDVIADFAETSAATPFWEAFDPFAERGDNPGYRPGTTTLS